MARKCMVLKALKKPKFPTRAKRRCQLCGRARAYIGRFQLWRLCFRLLALKGSIPGVRKASW